MNLWSVNQRIIAMTMAFIMLPWSSFNDLRLDFGSVEFNIVSDETTASNTDAIEINDNETTDTLYPDYGNDIYDDVDDIIKKYNTDKSLGTDNTVIGIEGDDNKDNNEEYKEFNPFEESYEIINQNYTLEDDITIDGSLVVESGELNLNGHELNISGDLIHKSGRININGGVLTVNGSYRMQSYEILSSKEQTFRYKNGSSYLIMNNPNDIVNVKKDMVIWTQSSNKKNLTAGVFYIGGNLEFNKGCGTEAFLSWTDFKLCMNGKEDQRIISNGYNYITIANLKLDSAGKIISDGDITILNTLESDIEDVYEGQLTIKSSRYGSFKGSGFSGDLIIENAIFDSDYIIGGNITCNCNIVINRDKSLTVQGDIENNAQLSVYGNLAVEGNYNGYCKHSDIKDGSITIGINGKVEINGNASFNDYASLYFLDDTSEATIYGDLSFKDSKYGDYSRGTLYLGGDFKADYFKAGSLNTIVFNGDRLQTIMVKDVCEFGKIRLENHSEEGIVSKNIFNKNEIEIIDCNFRYDGFTGVEGYVLDENESIDGDLIIVGGEMDLNGHTLDVKGDLILMAGTLKINKGKLLVEKDFRQQNRIYNNDEYSYGLCESKIIMTNPEDFIGIDGNCYNSLNKSLNNNITNGTIKLNGDYMECQGASDKFFYPFTMARLVLTRNDHNLINNSSYNSRTISITNLYVEDNNEIDDDDNEFYVTGSDLIIQSSICPSEAVFKNALTIDKEAHIIGNKINGKVTFNADYNGVYNINDELEPEEILTVNGEVYGVNIDINNKIVVNGILSGLPRINKDIIINGTFKGTPYINADVTVNGDADLSNAKIGKAKLTVSNNVKLFSPDILNEDAYIYVSGDFTGYGSNTKLSMGTIEIKGDAILNGYHSAGQNKIILSGNKKQVVTTNNDADLATLELANTSKDGIYSEGILGYRQLIKNNTKLEYSYGNNIEEGILSKDTTYEGECFFVDGVLDLNGHTLTIDGNLNHLNGTININGGKLLVKGSLREILDLKYLGSYNDEFRKGKGVIVMQNSDDVIDIDGDLFLYNDYNTNLITSGKVYVGGDFKSYSTYNLIGDTKFIFDGTTDQEFYHYGKISSMEINTGGRFDVNGGSKLYVINELRGSCKNIRGTILNVKSLNIIEDGFNGDINLSGEDKLTKDLQINGNLKISNKLNTNGYSLYAQSMTIESDKGCLIMDNDSSYVGLSGYLSISGQNTTLTAGTIEVTGGLDVSAAKNLKAAGSNRIIVNRYRDRIASIKGPRTADSKLNTLILRGHESEFELNTSPEKTANEIIYEYETKPINKVENVNVSEISATSVKLSFDDKNVDVTSGYQIMRDGEVIGITSSVEYVDKNLSPETEYEYKIVVFGKYGDLSPESETISVTTLKDTTAPTAPDGIKIKSRSGKAITIAWWKSIDDVGVEGYRIYRDGKLIEDLKSENNDENDDNLLMEDSEGYLSYRDEDIDASNEAAYVYEIEAYDAAGNSKKSEKLSAQKAVPDIISVSPNERDYLLNGKNELKVTFKNYGIYSKNSVDIEYRYYNEADSEFKKINEAALTHKPSDSKELTLVCSFDTSELKENRIIVRYTLTDIDGCSVNEYIDYYIDNTAPQPVKIKDIEDRSGVINLMWDVSIESDISHYDIYRYIYNEDDEKMVYRMIGSTSSVNDNTYEDSDVFEGEDVYYIVSAVDYSGNHSELKYPESITVGADIVPPEVVGMKPSAGRVSDSVHITASAKDNKAVDCIRFYCRWSDENGFNDVVSSGTGNDLSEILSDDGMLIDTVGVSEPKKNIYAETEWNTKEIPDGIYQVKAVAVDTSGNDCVEVFSRRYVVDNTGISTIENIKASAGSTYVQLTWDDVSDTDFSYFSVLQLGNDGNYSEIQKVYDYTGCTIDGLEPLKNYSFKVAGVDDLGNVGEYSDAVGIKTVRDDKPPIINSIYPAQGRVNNTINLVISAKDNASLKEAVWSWSFDGKNYTELSRQTGEGASFDYRYAFDISDGELFPEGSIFIKSECFDAEGNKNSLMKDDREIVAEYIIDRTAPGIPNGFNARANEGNIELSWDKGNEEDIASYRIYKAEKINNTNSFGIYRKLADVESLNYFDTDIESGKAYSYQIECIDLAGNISKRSDSVYVTALPDNTIPEVRGVSPKDHMTIGPVSEITYFVTDNSYLGSLSVYIRPSESDSEWTKAYEKNNLSGMYVQDSFIQDCSDYDEGLYDFKFEVKDRAGNRGNEFIRTYYLDKTPCTGTIKTEDNDNKNLIKLNLNTDSSLDYSHFEVFRCEFDDASTDLEFKKKAVSIGESYNIDHTFEDKSAKSGVRYRYAAKIFDHNGNVSWSNIVNDRFIMIDREAPVIHTTDKITAIAGRSFMLSAGASTDNVKIKSFIWDVGDKAPLSGAYTEYKYDKAGMYKIKLTVTDTSGNSKVKTIDVDVKENNNSGLCKVVVTDSSGRPLPYSNVYINAPGDSDRFFMTDERGELYLAYKAGKYRIAAYKDGYLPREEETEIINTETSICKIELESGEVVVGDFEIHRMSLQEIVDSGVDVSDPANLNTFTFKTTLTFEKRPIPIIVDETPGEMYTPTHIDRTGSGGSTDPHFGDGPGEGEKVAATYIHQTVNGVPSPTPVPIIAIMSTTQTVSWLKTMYSANLTIMNAADSKYVIDDAVGSIELPDGVSLVRLGDGSSDASGSQITADTEKVDMGSIAGQEMKRVSWVIKGDKSGSYQIKARFDGTLLPFNVHVEKSFIAEQTMEVEQADVEILVMPESSAYIGEKYYIQYAITNNGNEPLYNFTTSIGDREEPAKKTAVHIMDPETGVITSIEESVEGRSYVIPLSEQIYQMPVLSGDDEITIPTLLPGQTIYGTWCLSAEKSREIFTGDHLKEFYELKNYVVTAVSEYNPGVKVKVKPIDSHISKYISTVWKGEDETIVLGDPVDLTSGAFTDSYTALGLIGKDILALDIQYDSRFAALCDDKASVTDADKDVNAKKASESDADIKTIDEYATVTDADKDTGMIKNTCGYGWYNDFDTWIEEKNGILHYYINPYVCVPFISEKSKEGSLYGRLDDEGIVLSDVDTDSDVRYVSFLANTDGYNLTRHGDGSYSLEVPSGSRFIYDSDGRLTQYISESGSITDISYLQNADGGITETVTEKISGNTLILIKDSNGLLRSVSDNAGRVSAFDYDEKGNLISITNPLGEKISYNYDSPNGYHLMTRSEDNEGELIVENSYDDIGRVKSQIDSAGTILRFDYNEQTDGGLKTVVTSVHDEITDITTIISNNHGFITYGEDKTGNVSYVYDSDDNLIHLENSNGSWTDYSYNESGKMTSVRQSTGDNVNLRYDESGNIIEVSSISESEKPELENKANYSYDDKGRLIEGTLYGNTVRYAYDDEGTLVSMETEGRGKCSFTSDKGRLTSYTNELGASVSVTYDSYGNINSVTNPAGGVTRYTYDAMDRLISVENPLGGVTRYTYNSLGLVTTETDPLGNTISYSYDASGRCTVIKYPDGSETGLSYDMIGRLIEKEFADGTSEKYSYDEVGKVRSVTYSDGSVETLSYNDKGMLSEITDAIGNVTGYGYDDDGKLTRIIASNGAETDIAYTGKDISEISLGEISSSVTYNSIGLINSETDPLGNTATYEYDSFGNMISAVDPKGNKTIYGYDKIGRCSDITYPNGLKVEQKYDLSGNVTDIRTEVGGKEIKYSYAYDKAGLLVSATDESGRKTSYSYDIAGRLVKVEDEFGNYSEYKYDCMGRISEESDNIGNSVKYEYDICGNPVHVTSCLVSEDNKDVTSKNYSYSYDKLGRLINVTDPAGKITSQEYDKLGQVTSVTDAMGGVTEYSYDRSGNLTEVKDPVGNITQYEYDSYGNLVRSIDARGNKTEYSYDKCGRLTELNDAEGVIKYSYDANGNLLTVSDKSGTITRTYDEMDRVSSFTDCNGNTLKYGYDELGNILSITYPGGEIVRYSYNPDGTLAEMTDGSGRKTIYGYDRQGRKIATTRPDGSVETLTYDERSNITIREDKAASGKTLQRYEYSYDEYGNITAVKETVDNDYKTQKEKDEITADDKELSSSVTTSMEYDAANRLIRYNGSEVKYDEDGNMIYGPLDGKMVSFKYDSRNRLIEADGVRYSYDAENIRISAESDEYSEQYVTDRVCLLSRTLEIKRNDKKNENILTTGKSVTRLYYGTGLVYDVTVSDNGTTADSSIKSDISNAADPDLHGDVRIYHFDHLGSTRYITDKTGKITLYFDYGTFGEFLGAYDERFNEIDLSEAESPVRYLYNGEYGVSTDSNGLLYMRQRYYNTDIKRFINRDIISGSILESQSLNRYSYVEGNPVNYLDPFGLSKMLNTLASIEGNYHALTTFMSDPINNTLRAVNRTVRAVGKVWSGLDTHTKLNILGALPGIGYVFDIANSIKYFREGEVEKGVESLIFALPTLNLYGGSGKIAKFITGSEHTAEIVGSAVQFLGTSTAAFTALAKSGKGLAGLIDTYVIGGAELDENFIRDAGETFSYLAMTTSFGMMMLKDYNSYYRATEAVVYGRVVNDEVIAWETPPEDSRKSELIEQSKTELASCFVAGTRIKTAEGDKNIEDIQAGDEVYACDVETGEVGLKKVKRTFIHEETIIVHVTIENTTIETTTEHPFYVEGYGFKYACDLQPGDEIRQLDGTTAEVQKIEYEYLDEPIYVYNFEVEDWHTYYVSDIGALVHNDCMAPPPTSGSEIKGGSKTNGIIDGKTPASRLADKVQGLSNSKRPNTVAVVRTADGRYYIGYNKAGVNNAEVQSIMDSLGNTNIFNRQCAEVNAISRAINKGANLDGATISVANVRSVGNYSGLHGTSKPPCEVCQPLLDYFGIEVVN